MDLIEKIETVIRKSGQLENPSIDLKYDEKRNVFGYIISESFYNKDDNGAQSLIWNILRNNLEKEELLRIFMIFNETPQEAGMKEYEGDLEDLNQRYWFHETPEKSKYWLFIDIGRQDNNYKTFYLTLNARLKFHKCLIYNYPKHIIEFMELEGDEEIKKELLNEVFKSGEAEISGSLIQRYEEFKNNGYIGKKNPYDYFYNTFKMTACRTRDLIFSFEEIQLIEIYLGKLNFPIIEQLKKGIEVSKEILKIE